METFTCMTNRTLLKSVFVLTITLGWLACKKSGSGGSSFNETKLVNKDWKSDKSTLPLIIMRFNSDKTGTYKSVTNIVTGTYQTFTFDWMTKGSDSVRMDFSTLQEFTMKVYSVTDTTLIMNNWDFGTNDPTMITYYSN
jgi:hypothetical protein